MQSRLTVVLVSLLLATSAVIFWLWLVILRARVAILCPKECWCDPGGYYVECSSSPLNNIPLIFPANVWELLLRSNNITSLEKDGFISRGLTELEKLTADFCEIRTIELGALNGLTKLTHLSMWGNKISEIMPGTFEKMSRLEHLVLSYNSIEHLQVGVFSGLINLKHVVLSVNKLQHLHPELLVGLPSLAYLSLVNNSNLKIPTDRPFIHSRCLKRLDMSYCNISSVSVETFAKVPALEWLDLRRNNLINVDINMLKALPKLSTLFLYDNPLQCDCQLQEVWRWCQDHNIQTAYGKIAPECDTPSEVEGIWWGVLEKGQCLNGNISYYGDYKNTSYSYRGTDVDVYRFVILKDFQAPDDLGFLKNVQAPAFAAPFIFGTIGNVIIIIIIISNKDMRTIPNMYILNLAISDMIYLVLHFSEAYINSISDTWLYGDFMRKFLTFCRRLSVGLSAYSVAVLSIQRYNVTVNPFHNRVSAKQTWRVTVATICGVWIVAALFAIPSALSNHSFRECYNTYCIIYKQRVVMFELLVPCLLPLCVIAFSYIMTARHLVKSARPISQETQNPQLNTRKNTAKIVVGLTVVFLISYVPYHVFWTYTIFKENAHFDVDSMIQVQGYKLQYTYLVSACLLLINSCFNPVAVFCTSSAFRRQFKRYLTCFCKATSPSQ